MDQYDLAIIGGGPAGYLAAERAASGGMKTILFEEEKLGGVCLNEGCIPTKAMLNSSKLLYYAKTGPSYGIKAAGVRSGKRENGGAADDGALDNVEFSILHSAVLARKEKTIRTLTAGVRSKLKTAGADICAGKAEISGRGGDRYIVTQLTGGDAGRQIDAARILIATGSSPIIPPIDGITQALGTGFAITSKEALSLAEIPEKLVIAGGGVIGLELADYFNAAGSSVTIVEMLDRVAYPMEAEISGILMNNLKKRDVEFLLGHKLISVAQSHGSNAGREIIIESADNANKDSGGDTGAAQSTGAKLLNADRVLLSVGRKPNITGFGLDNLGVYIERGAVATDTRMRTNIPNVYAAGDVNGKYMLAHTAYREAECAVSHMLGMPAVMRYDAIPSIVYTNPEIAGVGETLKSAETKGFNAKEIKLPLRYSGRYIAEVDGGDGICKIIFDTRKNTVIGAHICGLYASEIIFSAAFMIESHWTVEALRELTFPHPTVGEALREALFMY